MRILHVNKFLYRRGGAEAYMLDLASLQRDAGHEVEFFAMRHPDNLPARFDALFPARVDFDPPPGSVTGRIRGAGRLLWSTSAAGGMRAVLDRFRPDLVHLHNIYHQLSPSILGPVRQASVPSVMTLHDYKLVCPTYRFLDHGRICEACVPNRFWNAGLRRCNGGSFAASALNGLELAVHTLMGAYGPVGRFLCPSRFLEGKMRRSGVYPDRLRWLPNFVDAAATIPKTSAGGGVVYAGRLSDEKGVDLLVEAARIRSGFTVDIAGEGPARPALERLAARHGVADRIRFHGRLEKTALQRIFHDAAVLAAPSRWYENAPLTVLEGFASALPAVATDLGGLPELIEPGVDGLVVPPNDADALADAISSLVDDPERAAEMGRAGREKALGTYAPERHLANLEEHYADASSWVGRAT
jgi:glycosyltransferase involved in cell wall biosynthesis